MIMKIRYFLEIFIVEAEVEPSLRQILAEVARHTRIFWVRSFHVIVKTKLAIRTAVVVIDKIRIPIKGLLFPYVSENSVLFMEIDAVDSGVY